MAIERYKGQPKNITVKASSNPLAVYGYLYSDIIEIRMNLKKVLETDLDDAYLQKTSLDGGVVLDEPSNSFIMVLRSSDYTLLEIGTYYLTLNIQTEVGEEFIEIKIKDRCVNIVPDTNRN